MRPPTHLITFRGRTQSITQWCREFGIDVKTANSRLQRGWDYTKTFTTPVKAKV